MKKEPWYVYKLEWVDPKTGEISSYIGSSKNVATRMQQHSKKEIFDELCQTKGTEYEGKGFFARMLSWILSITFTPSDDMRNEESKKIKEEKEKPYRNINKRL